MADPWMSYVLTAIVIGELVIDKLPQAPSCKAPPGFIVEPLVDAGLRAALPISRSVRVLEVHRSPRWGRRRQTA